MAKGILTLCWLVHFILSTYTKAQTTSPTSDPFATTTTASAEGCIDSEGDLVPIGHDIPMGTCYFCSCYEDGGVPSCYIKECLQPMCVDFYLEPDGCCYICPNGLNCESTWGATIYGTQPVTHESGETCWCESKTRFGRDPSPLLAHCE